jgi:hypothetical protein
MAVYIKYMISANMAAGTGGNSSLRASNGTCVVRQSASSYSHSTVHDQCQYGCWYRWEQQPATIERHLCGQTNLIMVQSLSDKVDFYMSYCHRLLTCGCCVCACRYVILSPGFCQE